MFSGFFGFVVVVRSKIGLMPAFRNRTSLSIISTFSSLFWPIIGHPLNSVCNIFRKEVSPTSSMISKLFQIIK